MFTWIIYIIHKEPPGKHLEKEISSAVQHKEQNDCKEKKNNSSAMDTSFGRLNSLDSDASHLIIIVSFKVNK